MSEAGFFQQKRNRPGGLALVIALHAGALAAVMLIKGPAVVLPDYVVTKTTFITDPPEPPEIPPEPQQIPRTQRHVSIPDATPPLTNRPPTNPASETPTGPAFPPLGPIGDTVVPPADPPRPPAVRRDAEIDPRYADDLQPPYPSVEQRAQREGTVRIRVTIGADGRVRAAQRLAATSDAFWRAAEQQALRRWRFRPATLDGRPIETTKVMVLHFRLNDA